MGRARGEGASGRPPPLAPHKHPTLQQAHTRVAHPLNCAHTSPDPPLPSGQPLAPRPAKKQQQPQALARAITNLQPATCTSACMRLFGIEPAAAGQPSTLQLLSRTPTPPTPSPASDPHPPTRNIQRDLADADANAVCAWNRSSGSPQRKQQQGQARARAGHGHGVVKARSSARE